MNRTEEIINQLQSIQARITAMLLSVSTDSDWQPNSDTWSFKYIAAHLAVTEEECFLDRVTRIAGGNHPQFDYYLNTGRDFSRTELRNSLQVWIWARQALINFVQALPQEKLVLTGTHVKFGEVTIFDILRIMFDHDLEHLEELQQLITAYWQKSLPARCQREIEELHHFFQDWFNGDIRATAENFARLTAALDENFTLVGPDGKVTARQSLLDWITNAHGSRQGFKIWTEQFQFHHRSGDTGLVTYQEWQQPYSDHNTTARISSALFKKKPGAPNDVQWLHVHETWLEQ